MPDQNTEQNSEGIVYVLINAAMPGYVKIGRVDGRTQGDLVQRMRSLDRTSTPLPFECVYACSVKNAKFVEQQLHRVFSDCRVRPNREFFGVSPETASAALKIGEIEDMTPPQQEIVDSDEDRQALKKAHSRRENFSFQLLGIPVGAELTFLKDENIKAKVVSNKNIKIHSDEVESISDARVRELIKREEEMTVSAAANKILDKEDRVSGTIYWKYEGETLDKRRYRLENEE